MKLVAVEAVDRCGKSTLVNWLTEAHGFSQANFGGFPEGDDSRQKALFQKGGFTQMFKILNTLYDQPCKLAFDRCHLSEMVYGSIYRNDSGINLDYLQEFENDLPNDAMLLILLVNKDLDVLRDRDDGGSHDINRIGEEQDMFVDAFTRSNVKRKALIEVTGLSIEQVRAKAWNCITGVWPELGK